MRKRDSKACAKSDAAKQPLRDRKAKKSIPLPSSWKLPKYQFGQLTTDGTIVGLEFIPSKLQENFGTGGEWSYWISDNLDGDNISCFQESDVELFSLEKAQSLIDSEIDIHLSRIHLLVRQLQIAEEEHYAT